VKPADCKTERIRNWKTDKNADVWCYRRQARKTEENDWMMIYKNGAEWTATVYTEKSRRVLTMDNNIVRTVADSNGH